ncbi:hypothetical protein [Hymenobacter cellulosilyticus]|uniref:Uncharacterized protein n=1 Tax=Hymenobacter cellulosilyticus TaxID=2932248 RepID=A0A8T9QBE8_9BACT|nr:hypothetical protein [Hymenobacter cellulosilyticus]UOQ72859.1 hypothetical protein MUN79_02380 [Hymenobacter cellulosilyticus]
MLPLLPRAVLGYLLLLLLLSSTARAQTTPTEPELNTFYDQLNAYRTTQYQPLPDLEALRLPSSFSGPTCGPCT